MMKWYYLSSNKMTVAVEVEAGIITKTPPIVSKFIGQDLQSLLNWMRKQSGFKCCRIIGKQKASHHAR